MFFYFVSQLKDVVAVAVDVFVDVVVAAVAVDVVVDVVAVVVIDVVVVVGVVVVLIDVVTKSANFEFGCCDETLARKLKSREAKFRIPSHFLSILRNAIRTDRIKTSLKFRARRDATLVLVVVASAPLVVSHF